MKSKEIKSNSATKCSQLQPRLAKSGFMIINHSNHSMKILYLGGSHIPMLETDASLLLLKKLSNKKLSVLLECKSTERKRDIF